ncbi:NAD-dependent deacetylase [Microbacterium sp. STN6]|uniref:Sir2 family NAD-dependent protein deacetylase n=1 Tax=Microbacterium sp. STN6 TaxID=2995588 RepID=UPI002260E332|nr:Sir2 family NAD-dependent protein deacetylase [Microbacterium sp. STN6]MCX7521593.1 NAD-dependent deacetylase [Microbacterium sp. STN6]
MAAIAPQATPDGRALPAHLARLLDEAASALRGRRVVALTGAGMSTDSGIPDYRGEGSPKRTPMTIQQFLGDEMFQKRYWAGSHLGWRRFRAAEPNAGHIALAGLEAAGVVTGVATQNVDGLHTRAGSGRVVDLHGSMERVVCLDCGQVYWREDISGRIEEANPWLEQPGAVKIAPDGDAEVLHFEDFVLPTCTVCGGRLKPDVVFFGEFIPKQRFRQASGLVAAADAMLVAGSSLVVNSGIRLLEQARRRALPIVIVNRGETRGDARATVKLDAGTSETLQALASRLTADS